METESYWILDALGVDANPQLAGWILYGIIVSLTILVYHLGFAKKLPILKMVFIYAMLLAGCLLLQILAIFSLPIVESLAVAALILIVYKVRLRNEGSAEVGE
jgi:hypothetical protein